MIVNHLHRSVAVTVGLLLCAGSSAAWAQSAAAKAAADSLFAEGKQLIAQGDDAAACAKFEASLAKVAQLGTQIALATCYERLGRTASAWGAFRSAAGMASKVHDKRQRFAEDHASALEARLSKLVILIEPGHRVSGLEVKRDGGEVAPAELGSAVPVDPGEHTVEASAPGYVPWSTKVSIPSKPGIVEVPVPALHPLAEHGASPSGSARPGHRMLGYGLGAGGLAIVGASMIVGAVASSKWSDAQPHCHDRRCDPTGVALADRARTLGNVSTGLFIGGAVAVAAGVVVLLMSPSAENETPQMAHRVALRLVPDLGPARVGVTLRGGF